MSDAKLRAELRKARETSEWNQYLVEAQRAGILLEDVLLETQGAAIPLIQKYSTDLSKFYGDVNLKVAEWMLKAEGLPSDSMNPQIKNDILAWTYAVLEMRQKAREFIPLTWHSENRAALEKLLDSPNKIDARKLDPTTDMTVVGLYENEAEKVNELTCKLKNGHLKYAETFAAKLPSQHRFRAYVDFSIILKNKERQND